MSSAYLQSLEDSRPQLDPETPFAEVTDLLTDAIIAVARVADRLDLEPTEFLEEFGLREEQEQTQFGVNVTLATLTLNALVQHIAGGTAAAFENADS